MKRLERTTFMALLGAAGWSAALLVSAFFFPAYSSAGEEVPSAGAVTQAPATLTGVNGPGSVAAVALPLMITLAVATALWLGSRRGAIPVAWVLTGLLTAFTLITMASVGLFILPVTVALIIACCTCQPNRRGHAVTSTAAAPAPTAGERTA